MSIPSGERVVAVAEDNPSDRELNGSQDGFPVALFVAEALLLSVVLLLYPVICWVRSFRFTDSDADVVGKKSMEKEMRGLYLPRGSVRAMLALIVIGTFIVYLVFSDSKDENVIAVFGTLSAGIIGFYFGSRSSSPPPE